MCWFCAGILRFHLPTLNVLFSSKVCSPQSSFRETINTATSWLERMGKTAFLRFLTHSPFSFSTDKVEVLNNCPHVYLEGPDLSR